MYPVIANGVRTGDARGFHKDVVGSSVKVPEFDKHLKKTGGHIGRNVVEIIKMKTIVRKPLMIKIRTYCTLNGATANTRVQVKRLVEIAISDSKIYTRLVYT